MRPYKHENFIRKHTVQFNEKVIYTLYVSNTTIQKDRFNTKEQLQWCIDHNRQMRKGILMEVYEKVPQGEVTFKDREEEFIENKKMTLNERNRRFIAKIKDIEENYVFFINLWNVEFEQNYIAKIITTMAIPDGWVKHREYFINLIGIDINTIIEQNRKRKRANRFEERRKRFEKIVGTSKLAYANEKERIKTNLKVYKKKVVECNSELNELDEYWSEISKENRTV